LEYLPEFNGFNDWLNAFALYRGKKSSEDDDDDHRIVGKFKVLFDLLFEKNYYRGAPFVSYGTCPSVRIIEVP